MGKISFVDYTLEVDKNILLDNVNINLVNGNTYFITGKNGCGKSTFLKTLTKEYDNYSGNIFIDNINIKDLSIEELFGTYISYLPQIYETKNPLSFKQMVDTLYPNIDKDKLNMMIKELDLRELIKKPFAKLSGGQQQRILFAFHILSDNPIIILDEFENNLDTTYLNIVTEIIKNENKLLIIVTHIGNFENGINLKFENYKLIIQEKQKLEDKNFKYISNNIKTKKIFGLFFHSGPVFHSIYLFSLICIFLVAILAGFHNIDAFRQTYMPKEELAEITNDASMAIICSGCVSYQYLEYAHDDIPSDELYFDYSDYEALQEAEGVEEVVITANPYAGSGSAAMDGFLPKPVSFEYENLIYETSSAILVFPKELIIKMPVVYSTLLIPTYGEIPNDNTNEILVPEALAYAYYGSDANLEDKIGTSITLIDEQGNKRDFVISGFYDSNIYTIYYSYHSDDPNNLENNAYLGNKSTDEEIKSQAIDSAYSSALNYSKDLTYEQFMEDNPDLIEGFYIELEDPKYMDDIENMIWEKYPNAVIMDDNVFNTHPPLNTLMPIFGDLIKKVIIIMLVTIIILVIILFSYNVKRSDLKQFLLRNGVNKKIINRAELLDTSLTILLAFIVAIIPCILIYDEPIFYFGTIMYFILLVVVIILCDIVIKKILAKVYNVKN